MRSCIGVPDRKTLLMRMVTFPERAAPSSAGTKYGPGYPLGCETIFRNPHRPQFNFTSPANFSIFTI